MIDTVVNKGFTGLHNLMIQSTKNASPQLKEILIKPMIASFVDKKIIESKNGFISLSSVLLPKISEDYYTNQEDQFNKLHDILEIVYGSQNCLIKKDYKYMLFWS